MAFVTVMLPFSRNLTEHLIYLILCISLTLLDLKQSHIFVLECSKHPCFA